ncbi:Major facilitator superfamily transporter [Pyrenophora tritici-repentis]|nr:Major facilitator superfamily transporter [Pyrenophora tritici-repentis]
MVSEVVDDQKYKPRAFLLMPMAFNVAVILGPILAYLVVAAADGYAETNDERGSTSASNRRYPFAPPALLNGAILLTALLLVVFRLREHQDDPGLNMARKLGRLCFGPKSERYAGVGYQGLREEHDDGEEMMPSRRDSSEEEPTGVERNQIRSGASRPASAMLPLSRIFTCNLCLTIASQAILEGHVGAYNTLWPSFLSASVVDDDKARNVWRFSGGLGMPIRDVARSLVILGVFGLPLQVFGYPRVVQKFGTLGLWRVFLLGFPLAYSLTPLLAVLPSNSPPPAPRDGAVVWSMIVLVQALVVLSGTFVLPAQLTLTNNLGQDTQLGCFRLITRSLR